ncbi:MAG: patatin-like phospholipase family protein [Anaerolineae bacterium]
MRPDDLRASELFYGLSDEELELVIASMKPEYYAKGTTVVRPGETVNQLYFVGSGRLRVTEAGTERGLGYLGPGDFFGEMTAFLPGQKHAAGLEVVIDATLFSLSQEDLQTLLLEYPQMALRLNYTILRRFAQPTPAWSNARGLVAVSGPPEGIVRLVNELAPYAKYPTPSEQRSLALLPLADASGFDDDSVAEDVLVLRDIGLEEVELSEALSRQLDVFQHVLIILPETPTSLAAKALNLAEIVVGLGQPAPWVQDATPPDKLWQSEVTAAALEKLARRIAGRRVGLVLSSGGSKCVAHVGVLTTLRKASIPIDFIAGVSGGALFGAAFALGFNDEKLYDFVKRLASMNNPRFWDVNLPPRAGLLKARRVRDELDRLLDGRHFSDLEIPMVMIATDIKTGEAVELDRGSLADAVRASMSLPGIADPWLLRLPGITDPWHHQDRFFIDGGVVNPLPTDVIRRRGANIVIASDVTVAGSGADAPRTHLPTGRAPTIFQVISSFLSMAEAAHIEPKARQADILIRPGVRARSSLDFDQKDEFLARGEAVAEAHLPHILSKLYGTPMKIEPKKEAS